MATARAASCTVQGIRSNPTVSARAMVDEMARAAKMKPTVSKGPGWGWRVFGTNFQTASMPSRQTGTLM